jgi:hypothetical protein
MSDSQESKSGRPAASGMFRPDATLQQKVVVIALMCAAIADIVLMLYGRATHRTSLSLIGAVLFLGPLGAGVIWSRIRAKRDPAFAQRLAETRARLEPMQRARQSQLKLRMTTAAVILVALLGLGLLRPVIPVLAHIGRAGFVVLAQILGVAVALALWFGWRFMRTRAKDGKSQTGSGKI